LLAHPSQQQNVSDADPQEFSQRQIAQNLMRKANRIVKICPWLSTGYLTIFQLVENGFCLAVCSSNNWPS